MARSGAIQVHLRYNELNSVAVRVMPWKRFGRFPLLDRRGRRERLSLIASGGVVDKLMLAQRSVLLRCLIYHPVCASKEGDLFLYGAATPPGREGKFSWPIYLPRADSDRLFSSRVAAFATLSMQEGLCEY